MEGRKFGVGLCVVTQQPKNVDPRVLAQMNTFVVMGLSDRNDRAIIAGHAKQDLSPMDTEIQTLEPGEAIISTLGIPFPVSTRIHLYRGVPRGPEREEGEIHPRGARFPVLRGLYLRIQGISLPRVSSLTFSAQASASSSLPSLRRLAALLFQGVGSWGLIAIDSSNERMASSKRPRPASATPILVYTTATPGLIRRHSS